MNFIDQKEIYDKTNCGRDVIEAWYPNSADCFNNPLKKFKVRGTEKTASASVKKMPDGIWVVTDFGGDQKSRNCIQMVAMEENCDFKTAIHLIAAKFNIIPEEKQTEIFKPGITKRDATPDEQDGVWYFFTKEFTMTEVTGIIAPKVWEYLISQVPKEVEDKLEAAMAEVLRIFHSYHFHSLKGYTIIKDRKAIEITSNDTYPIFMFDEVTDGKHWKKIYQPRQIDAGKRFMHYGGRPSDFIFGYTQALKAYNEIIKIDDEEQDEESEAAEKKDKKKKSPKLKKLVITSGGSDGLNLACLGQCFKGKKPEHLAEQIFPVWMNSETAKLSPGQFKNFQSISETVYNIPDIDYTGKRAAHDIALLHLDLHTLYLPDELKEKKDGFRNKECKDLRDYFKFYEPKDLLQLFKTAYPYRFWDVSPRFNKQGEFLGFGFNVNNKYLLNFLARNGFYRFSTEVDKEGYFYIHIKNNVVSEIQPKDIRDFVNTFIEKRNPEVELMNTFLRTTQMNETSLSNLPFIEIDFSDFDRHTQWMFFPNRTVKITATSIEDFRPGDIAKFVWDDEVIPHRVKLLDNFFEITQQKELFDKTKTQWNITIKTKDDKGNPIPQCLILRYLINGSRIYWREELERRLEGIPEKDREAYAMMNGFTKDDWALMEGKTKEEQANYREEHKFSIAGPLLIAGEAAEQKLHLINKIYSLGYIFHRYKEASKAWAIWTMDAKQSEGDESHGGSGKSLLPGGLLREHNLIKNQYREGRDNKLTEDKHIYEGITEHTDMLLIDDCHRYLKLGFFFGPITGPLQVNPKNNKQYTVPRSAAPKFWFTSNFPPIGLDPSMERRILYTIFSDYYHANKMSEYREERKVSSDFGKDLGTDFNEAEWNLFLNFILQCTRFYLSCDEKINPPMDNINKRNLKAIMGDAFEPWADVYFSPESARLDSELIKVHAMDDFRNQTKQTVWTTQKFTSALKAWCHYNNFDLNPKEFLNGQGRYIRKREIKDKQGATILQSCDMIYIKTKFSDEPVLVDITTGKETRIDFSAPADKKDDDEMPF